MTYLTYAIPQRRNYGKCKSFYPGTVLTLDQRDRRHSLKTSVSIRKLKFSTPATVYIITQYSDNTKKKTVTTSLHQENVQSKFIETEQLICKLYKERRERGWGHTNTNTIQIMVMLVNILLQTKVSTNSGNIIPLYQFN